MHSLVALEVPAGRVGVHWFEQSSYAVKDPEGTLVLVDPYFPHQRPAERYLHPEPPVQERELPADYVLLTHDHSDHTHPETIRRLVEAHPHVHFFGPKESIARIVQEAGVDPDRTNVVQAGEEFQLGTMTAWAVWAKPPHGDPNRGIAPPDVTHLGYVVQAGEVRLYFSGDPIHTFAEQEALIEAIARLRPDVGFLTTHPSEGEFPFFEGSAQMARRIGLKHAVPAHYDCFVRRNYDPQEWAAYFGPEDPQPLIIPRNTTILYPPD
ncbi:MAG: hypothetical protein KatS3mg115_0124 [Candidatus Poribacteria bacterium]|nr:MAG: hypothetical protein KatS3mg115_0124 [Candidatus Poribacteria bacterium]